jgi:hypothetical protein
MKEPGNDDVLIESCSIENPGHGHDVLEIGQLTGPPHLAPVAERGVAEGLFEAGGQEWER